MKLEFEAKTREVQGTGASRRLRRDGLIPGVLYGGEKAAVMIEMDHNDLFKKMKVEAFHASLLTMLLDGKKETVLLRDYQMHPFKQQIYHIDFQRVNTKQEITIKIPFHFINADIAPGVKLANGMINHAMTEIEVRCLPKDLPEYVTIDLANLEAGAAIHVKDIDWPKGVKPLSVTDDTTVANCIAGRGGSGAEEDAAEAESAE